MTFQSTDDHPTRAGSGIFTDDLPTGSQGLGWFLRRTRTPAPLARFYENALGLVRLRSWDLPETAGEMLWCGDVGVVEINCLDADTPFKPEASPCLPVFGSVDIEASLRKALAAGAAPIKNAFPNGYDIHGFKDPDGFLFGIEAVIDAARLQLDCNDRSWPGKPSNLPGGVAIDGPILCMTRVIHLTHDLKGESAFLTQLGFKAIAADRISIGGMTEIVLVQADRREPYAPITNREMSHDTWIARVYGFQTYRAALQAFGRDPLSSLEFPGGRLDYALTPSNVLVGWQERKAYDPDIPTTQMIEDQAARTHWINKMRTSHG